MSAQRASQLVEAGLWLRLSGDQEGAKRLFEQALKLDPANARARQLLDSPPPAPSSPVHSGDTPAVKTSMDLDWGLATGHTPTPPPVPKAQTPPPVQSSSTRQHGSQQGQSHTIRLGENTAPEIPDAPSFDPSSEVFITTDDEPQDSSTLVFGMNGVPAAPPPELPGGPGPSSTMVFSGTRGPKPTEPPPNVQALSGGTMVFGGKDAPPPVAPVGRDSGGGTLVFGSSKDAPPPVAPVGRDSGSGTLVFGSSKDAPIQLTREQSGGTLVFGNGRETQPLTQPMGREAPGGGTLVFGSGRDVPQVPSVGREGSSSTMVYGSAGKPPPVAPVGREQHGNFTTGHGSPRENAVSTEPGVPPFMSRPEPVTEPTAPPVPEPSPTPPPAGPQGHGVVPSSSTLEFNFDDMLNPPRPVPSPPVAYDRDDGTQTAWDRSNPRIDISSIGPGEGGGFDLISSDPPPTPKQRSPAQLKEEVATLLAGAKDLLDLDDHSGAMELINKALELDPADAAALRLKDRSEKTLQAMFESKLGDLNTLPRVKLKDDEIIWLNLDHRAGFVLAQIDGQVTFEDLFAVSGMSRLDTARILAQLVEEGVITRG